MLSSAKQQEILGRAYRVIYARWREAKQKKNELWISDTSHHCNSDDSCNITNMRARVYEFSNAGRQDYHVCTDEQSCKNKALHRPAALRATINNVFICEKTGKFHVCGANCSEPMIRSTASEFVCRMSGLTRGSDFHDSYTLTDDKGSISSLSRKRKAVDSHHPSDQSQKKQKTDTELWLAAMGLDSKSVTTAMQVVDLLLFNKRRQQLENSRLKKIGQQAKAVVTTYIRRCKKNSKIISVMYAQWLYEDYIETCRPPPYLHTLKCIADRIVEYYAYFSMAVYSKLVRYVFSHKRKVGEEDEDEEDEDIPTLKECIPAILYTMREEEGLKAFDDTPLLSEDMFLKYFLPEQNTLNHFNIKKTQFTRVRNRITTGTAYAIEAELLCPAQLTVTPLSLEDLLQPEGRSIPELFIAANPAC